MLPLLNDLVSISMLVAIMVSSFSSLPEYGLITAFSQHDKGYRMKVENISVFFKQEQESHKCHDTSVKGMNDDVGNQPHKLITKHRGII